MHPGQRQINEGTGPEPLSSVGRAHRPNVPKTCHDPQQGICQTPERPEPWQAEFPHERPSYMHLGQPNTQLEGEVTGNRVPTRK